MRNLVISFLAGVLIYNTPFIRPASALDKSIVDGFSTNPMTSRWCERWHHVHWFASPLNYMRGDDSVFPNPGECDQGPGVPGSCCVDCRDDTGDPDLHCSSTTPAFFAITSVDYEGIDPRTAEVEFALSKHFIFDPDEGNHVALFSVTHPNCHGGVQAIVVREENGEYRLGILAGLDELMGFCSAGGGGSAFTAGTVPLVTSFSPRYRLRLQSAYSAEDDAIGANAKLIDLQSGVILLERTATFTGGDLTWYNTTTRRFGFGGGPQAPPDPNGYVIFDNFSGKAGC